MCPRGRDLCATSAKNFRSRANALESRLRLWYPNFGKVQSTIAKLADLSDDARAILQNASRELHGSRYRLEIYCYVAQSEGRVYAHGLARTTGLTDKLVGNELRRLERAGLLEVVAADDPGQKRQYYRRLDSCFWTYLQSFSQELAERV
jgi:DNA-binding transcriptional ArsR family regulator